jgi:hypothetical protein
LSGVVFRPPGLAFPLLGVSQFLHPIGLRALGRRHAAAVLSILEFGVGGRGGYLLGGTAHGPFVALGGLGRVQAPGRPFIRLLLYSGSPVLGSIRCSVLLTVSSASLGFQGPPVGYYLPASDGWSAQVTLQPTQARDHWSAHSFYWSPLAIISRSKHVHKTLGITLTTAALMFGGAGVANATAPGALVPSSTTTTLAEDATNDDGDNTGLWGLAGLLGLLGLAGLKRRNDTDIAAGAARGPSTPRV